MRRTFIAGAIAAAAAVLAPQPAAAQDFNWRAQEGRTITLLLNNHPWSQAIREMAVEFTAQTGIRTRIEIFNEE